MKMIRGYLLLLPVFILALFANVMKVNAVDTGFKTNQLPSEEKNRFISKINILLMDEEPIKKPIMCFDVNNNRLIAIGQNTSARKTICIYSDEGVFQYGYTFNCSGDFGIEWDEENINIVFVRSSVIVSVNPQGEVLDVLEIQNTIENDSYVNHFIHSTKRKIGETEYFIENDMGILNLFASSYSQIIVKDGTGAENIIYDVSSMQLLKLIVIIGVVSIFVLVAIAVIICRFRKTD